MISICSELSGPEKSADDYTVSLPANVQLVMKKIPAGSFMMGSPESELGHEDNETLHQVILTNDFWIGQYEVTQEQYQAVMGTNPSCKKGRIFPVEQVSREDAMKFCQKLNDLYEGKLPNGYQFTLPTEAQWEYACRAGTTTALNSGKDLTDPNIICPNMDETGWYYMNSFDTAHPWWRAIRTALLRGNDKKYDLIRTHPAGEKKPNAWGLYDMHGNVYEWCSDWGLTIRPV